MMGSKLEQRKAWVILVAVTLVFISGVLSVSVFGIYGISVPICLMLGILLWAVFEFRQYSLDLFVRQFHASNRLFSQIEAYQGVLNTLQPRLPLPATRGWAASPDFLREVIMHVLQDRPECVVEASSGTSTLVLGYCMERSGRGHVYSLEHEIRYAERTRKAVLAHGLDRWVTVIHAPLVGHTIRGEEHRWYDLSGATFTSEIDLLVVDGPPDTIQPLARYPAFPVLEARLSRRACILLDDGARADERTIAHRWAEEHQGVSLEFLDLESGGWKLQRSGE